MDTEFCREALEEALARYGTPEIFNTDQGSQFTSAEFTDVLHQRGIRISMDGKGAWRDKGYVSHCTSFVGSERTFASRRRRQSLTPCVLRGALLPGGSNRNSFLSL
jgi:putative transposase